MSAPLDQVVVRLSATREITLAQLLEAWQAHVERIHIELDFNRDVAWTAHDLVAALLLRDRIEDVLARQPAGVRAEAAEVLTGPDTMFSDMTVEDSDGLVRRFAENEEAEAWWWSRVPRRGPIRADLDDWQQLS
ncbi:hypothetical protein SAMN05444157_2813 [Frankineae bacterium MT45]|nr:hypothetical protein SAMN05444157_2813 [Frankineae bacterium MT45]